MVLLYCAYARCGFCRDSALSIAQTASLLGHARLLDRAFLLALTGPGRLLMPEPGIVLASSQHSVPGDCNPLRSSKMSKSVFPRTRIRVLDQTRQLGRSAKQQRSMDGRATFLLPCVSSPNCSCFERRLSDIHMTCPTHRS